MPEIASTSSQIGFSVLKAANQWIIVVITASMQLRTKYITAINGLWGVGLEFPERDLDSPGQNGKNGQRGEPLDSKVTEKESKILVEDTILIHLKDICMSVLHWTYSLVLLDYLSCIRCNIYIIKLAL